MPAMVHETTRALGACINNLGQDYEKTSSGERVIGRDRLY
jgi:hypothetical protein